MSHEPASAPVTIRAAKDMMSEIDVLATAMDRSRNYVINQAIRQFLDTHAWQVERIKAGLEDVRAGRVRPADDVLAEIAAEHGWQR